MMIPPEDDSAPPHERESTEGWQDPADIDEMPVDSPARESPDDEVLKALDNEPSPRLVFTSDVDIEGTTLPDDLPGLASSTDQDLTTLFDNTSRRHLADGFIGSGDEDGANISQNDGDDTPDLPERPSGA